MSRRVRNAINRIGRVGEGLVRGVVDTATGLVGGLTEKEQETPDPIVTTPITQEKPAVEEVVTPTGQLSQSDKKDTSDTGLGDVESIFNAVTTGESSDPFTRLMKKNQDEERKKKAVM